MPSIHDRKPPNDLLIKKSCRRIVCMWFRFIHGNYRNCVSSLLWDLVSTRIFRVKQGHSHKYMANADVAIKHLNFGELKSSWEELVGGGGGGGEGWCGVVMLKQWYCI